MGSNRAAATAEPGTTRAALPAGGAVVDRQRAHGTEQYAGPRAAAGRDGSCGFRALEPGERVCRRGLLLQGLPAGGAAAPGGGLPQAIRGTRVGCPGRRASRAIPVAVSRLRRWAIRGLVAPPARLRPPYSVHRVLVPRPAATVSGVRRATQRQCRAQGGTADGRPAS